MACTSPLNLYPRDPDKFNGVRGMTTDPRKALIGGFSLTVACGRCIECRLAYAVEWSIRCMNEKATVGPSVFVTLTYDDEHLPEDYDLHYRDFQLFMHKLRKAVPGGGRFFMCGEYGDDYGRPHFHAILFNCDFADKQFYKRVDGVDYYISQKLTSLWGNGFTLLGDVTFTSAGYVARYSVKKITGAASGDAYQYLEEGTGEVFDRRSPFSQSSLKPGIGYEWFMRYHSDIYPCDFVVHGGRQFPVPRYYAKLYERMFPADAAALKASKKSLMAARRDDPEFSMRRLLTKHELGVLLANHKRELS
nr:MAG: replication initiator protein [Microvirus sp.]